MQIFADSNLLRLHSNFVRWASQVDNMKPAFEKFIPQFQKSRVGWIYAGRNVDGDRKAPLTAAYKIQKERMYGNQPILIASGVLINAIRGGQGWKQKVSKKELFMEIDLPYASFHQDGTRKMSQRNYFLTKHGTLNKMDYAQLMQAMEGEIQESTEAILNETLSQMFRR